MIKDLFLLQDISQKIKDYYVFYDSSKIRELLRKLSEIAYFFYKLINFIYKY